MGKDSEGHVKCPYCAEWVKVETKVCRFCHKEISNDIEMTSEKEKKRLEEQANLPKGSRVCPSCRTAYQNQVACTDCDEWLVSPHSEEVNSARGQSMREDFYNALLEENIPDLPSRPRNSDIEAFIPRDSKVLLSLSGGMLLLLDNGVLKVKTKSMWSGDVSGAELIPFAHIKGVSVEDEAFGGFTVEIHRNENSKVIAGSSFSKDTGVRGLTASRDHALKFQSLFLGLMEGPTSKQESSESALDRISKLKELLDSGAITQAEFDDKKKQLLDSI